MNIKGNVEQEKNDEILKVQNMYLPEGRKV